MLGFGIHVGDIVVVTNDFSTRSDYFSKGERVVVISKSLIFGTVDIEAVDNPRKYALDVSFSDIAKASDNTRERR